MAMPLNPRLQLSSPTESIRYSEFIAPGVCYPQSKRSVCEPGTPERASHHRFSAITSHHAHAPTHPVGPRHPFTRRIAKRTQFRQQPIANKTHPPPQANPIPSQSYSHATPPSPSPFPHRVILAFPMQIGRASCRERV